MRSYFFLILLLFFTSFSFAQYGYGNTKGFGYNLLDVNNPFDQDLNTYNNVQFNSLELTELKGNYTGGAINVNVYDNGTVWAGEDLRTGWIEYISNDYNTTNRLTINSLMNFTMTNYTIRDQEKPMDVSEFFNGSHILVSKPGDSYLIRMRYEAEPKVPLAYCEFYTYIDGAIGQLPMRAITFPRGVNVETIGVFTNFEYGLNTWYENGGLIQIECPVGDVEFWDLELTIERLHIGRGIY